MYDWTQPGEFDVVVEDIEKIDFDNIGLYELKQEDWRFGDEETVAAARIRYTSEKWVRMYMDSIDAPGVFEAEHFFLEPEDNHALDNLAYWVKQA